MRFGSVCSGIEAASVAWHPLGWRAAWLAEIEPFPCAVLAHHYPEVPNLGDMTTITRRVLTGEVEAPDVFTGGTPCQAFSVAGLRRSLDDARGNLSLTFCEIADAIDHVRVARGDQPAVIVWENVPGVLSTKDNAFGCFLAGLAGEDEPLLPPGGRWTDAGLVHGPARAVAWRTLDAQYFGVAQRRRRVFVVASARDGFDPAEVLFEWDRVRRDSAPRRDAREGAAAGSGAGAGGGVPDTARCVTAGEGKRGDWETCTMVAQPVGVTIHGTDPTVQKVASYDDTAQCLRARTPGNIDNSSTTVVQQPVAFDTTQVTSAANYSNPKPGDPCHPLAAGAHPPAIAFHPTQDPITSEDGTTHAMGCGSSGGGATVAVCVTGEVFHTLRAEGFDASEDGTGRGAGAVAVGVDCYNGALTGEVAATMGTSGSPVNSAGPQVMQAVSVALRGREGGGACEVGDDCAFTLRASSGGGDKPHAMTGMAVRRLTPRECERLQGFPDDWTLIPWRGKPADQCPDGPRYKALGNSWAVPVARWVGQRIAEVLA